jgi:hypothetical protein
MAEATRRKVLDMLVADKMLVQTFHAPFPASGIWRRTAKAIASFRLRGAQLSDLRGHADA